MKSIRVNTLIILFNILIMIITAGVFTVLVSANILNHESIFSTTYIICFITLVLLIVIFSTMLVNEIFSNIRKIEKNMKVMLDGKIVDIKNIKNDSKIKDINSFTNIYLSTIEVIKRNNFALNSQESKTEIILEHMADGVIAFSVMQDVVHMNKSAISLLQIDDRLNTFVKIIQNLKLNIKFEDVMYSENNNSYSERLNIGENVVNLVFVPFYSKDLTPMGVILMIRNITESARLDNMRKEFVANVSHEFKTPLTSIKGYSETMMRVKLSEEEIEDFARVINREASRMDRLVGDLLQLSKFDYNKVAQKKVNINMVELTKSVVEKMELLAVQKEHKLEFEFDKIAKVYADKDSIEQVLINVISNSIKYTPDGGAIKVKLISDNEKVYITISDNGLGIPKKDLERIFERFYRVDKARSRQMGGTGLGLSIVKEILDSNKGTINMESELDVGTVTTITLPIAINRINV